MPTNCARASALLAMPEFIDCETPTSRELMLARHCRRRERYVGRGRPPVSPQHLRPRHRAPHHFPTIMYGGPRLNGWSPCSSRWSIDYGMARWVNNPSPVVDPVVFNVRRSAATHDSACARWELDSCNCHPSSCARDCDYRNCARVMWSVIIDATLAADWASTCCAAYRCWP